MRRPRFHLTPVRNWMNDPNGLVHHDGLWHAYFQYNPEGVDWGNMSWGHATSRDLRTWDEQPVAIRHTDAEGIFSGSAVDTGDELVAYFTSARPGHQAQHRAVSTDGGFTWTRDAGNPLLDRGTAEFRDPKITRYVLPSGEVRWILVAVEAVERRVLFYASSDLRTWEEVDSFGPVGPSDVVWECPDLVRLPVDGSDTDARWVLILSTNTVGEQPDPTGSTMHYVVGDFDGSRFTPDSPELVSVDHGRDMYAGVTFDSAPGGEAVMLGWMSNWRYAHVVPEDGWRGAMSLPRVLSLRRVDGALQLVQEPVGFVAESLAGVDASAVDGSWERSIDGHALFEVEWNGSSDLSLRISGGDGFAEVTCAGGSISLTREGPAAEAVHPEFPVTVSAPLLAVGPQRLVVSLDGPLLEVFADDGATILSSLVMLGPGKVRLALSGAETVKLVEM